MCVEDGSFLSSQYQPCKLVETMLIRVFNQWVGGVVAERNFNFFIQFCSYAGLYAFFVMIVMAVFVAEARSKVCASLIPCSANADLTAGEFTGRQLDCWTDSRSCFHTVCRRNGHD
jgi:hypothetical protein